MSELLTVKEVAAMLKVEDQTVRRYIKTGRIKARKINSRDIRIDPNEVRAFVEQAGKAGEVHE